MSAPERTRKVEAHITVSILCAEDQEEHIVGMAEAMLVASKGIIIQAANSAVGVANGMAGIGERATPIILTAAVNAGDKTEADAEREGRIEAAQAAEAAAALQHLDVAGNA